MPKFSTSIHWWDKNGVAHNIDDEIKRIDAMIKVTNTSVNIGSGYENESPNVTIGIGATSGSDSVVIGNDAKDRLAYGVAIGKSSDVNSASVAIGTNATAIGTNSVAIGHNAYCNEEKTARILSSDVDGRMYIGKNEVLTKEKLKAILEEVKNDNPSSIMELLTGIIDKL